MMRSLFNRTVKPVYVLLRRWWTEWWFERRRGVRTTGVIHLEELGLDGEERGYYAPAGWLVLRRILRRGDLAPEDVFIDYGSGLGRVVLQAAWSYPFRRVIGVELSEQLNEIARANIERTRHRLRCPDVELITADALEYDPPPDVTLAFFFNPFGGELFNAVIHKLIASVDHYPRTLRIIYRNPVEHERLMATGRVRLIRRARGWRPGRAWSVSNSTHLYAVLPARESVGDDVTTAARSAISSGPAPTRSR